MILDLTTHESDYELNYSENEFNLFALITLFNEFEEDEYTTWIVAPFNPSIILEESPSVTASNPPSLIMYFPDSHSVAFNRFDPSVLNQAQLDQINNFFNTTYTI